MDNFFSMNRILMTTIDKKTRTVYIIYPISASASETKQQILNTMRGLNWKPTGTSHNTTLHGMPALSVGFHIPLLAIRSADQILKSYLSTFGWKLFDENN